MNWLDLSLHRCAFSVIVNDLDCHRLGTVPLEADAPLLVYSNAPLTAPVAPQRLEPVTRWHTQIVESAGSIDDLELVLRPLGQHWRETPNALAREKAQRILIAKPLLIDHQLTY
jgi:hypothetical protein